MIASRSRLKCGSSSIQISGSGAPALFLHGVPDTSAIWNDVISGVDDRFRCYAPDLPGFGHSALPEDFNFELRAYGHYVNSLIDDCGIETPLTLVLHDWGAIFGLSFAAQFPDRVAAIVAADFPFSHLYRWHPWARIWQTPLLGELSMLGMNLPLFRHEIRRGSRMLEAQTIRRMFQAANNRLTKSTILKLYRSAPPHLFYSLQAEFRQQIDAQRIHLLWGDSDPYISSHIGRQTPHDSFRVVENCGHWLPAEHPEAVIQVLRELNPDNATDRRRTRREDIDIVESC